MKCDALLQLMVEREVEAGMFALRLIALGVPRETADQAWYYLAPGKQSLCLELLEEGIWWEDAITVCSDTLASYLWTTKQGFWDLAHWVGRRVLS